MTTRKTIVGYADSLRVTPGGTIRFMVSAEGGGSYRASMTRLVQAGVVLGGNDPALGMPGFELDTRPHPASCDGVYPARRQRIATGSYIFVPPADVLRDLKSFTVELYIWATTPAKGRQALLGTYSPVAGEGFALALDDMGAASLVIGGGGEPATWVSTGRPVAERTWTRIAASYDAATGHAAVVQRPVAQTPAGTLSIPHASASRNLDPTAQRVGGGALLMAAWQDLRQDDSLDSENVRNEHTESDDYMATTANFNGCIDSPRLADRALSVPELHADKRVHGREVFGDATLAVWDFARDISGEMIEDLGPNALSGVAMNLPTRAVPGRRWTGDEPCYHNDVTQYSAIHFHDDDLCDAGWDVDFQWRVPRETISGIYAVRLSHDADGSREASTDEIPFFVTPERGRPTAPVALLIPTATYLSYANQTLHLRPGSINGDPPDPPCENDAFLLEHPEFGLSQYDYHNDGHGVVFSSALRPILNLKGVGMPWGFVLDTLINAFLIRSGYPFDVITDQDLHEQGQALLDQYRVVMTGSHPEYWSSEMMSGLEGYLEEGGRLMYLGGNGFYWRVGFHPATDGVVEVRRAEDGTRPWIAEPGEYYHQFSGEYGGLWRRLGRAPNRLVGVGFAAQGVDSAFYRRTEASRDPRAAFIFDGVAGDVVGEFGLIGAASMEIDRFDLRLGSPAHALVVATSEGHSEAMLRAKEEFDMSRPHLPDPDVRADMTFFEGPAGGAVFSVGSISWATCLAHDEYDNSVAKITSNVLDRFLDRRPFDVPLADARKR